MHILLPVLRPSGGHSPGPIFKQLCSYLQHEWMRQLGEEGDTRPKEWEQENNGEMPNFSAKTAKGKR